MDKNTLLLRAVAQYLQRSGFPKALKQFCKKANIQKDELGTTSFDLQDIFFKYLDKSDPSAKNLECNSLLDSNTTDKHGNVDVETTKEAVNSRKKKRSDKSDAKADKVVDSKISEEIIANDFVPVEVKPKEKSKKKSKDKEINKKDSDSNGHNSELVEEPAKSVVDDSADPKHKKKKSKTEKSNMDSEAVGGMKAADPETVDEPKEKKKNKKKNKSLSDPFADIVVQQETDTANKSEKYGEERKIKDNSTSVYLPSTDMKEIDKGKSNGDSKKNEASKEDVIQGNKDSKKRKRLPSEDDATQPEHEKAADESKRRKTDASKNGLVNGNLEDKVEKSSMKKNEQNGSVEPKVPNRFQRVKIDDVVFADERLKDNSYWAKDGAENGYGAKAQEVLGLVRGRDFRHEKTKKKRGSYRGGQIDLQSHSIKFTFPDDD